MPRRKAELTVQVARRLATGRRLPAVSFPVPSEGLGMLGAGTARAAAISSSAALAFPHLHDGGEASAGPWGRRGPLTLTTASSLRRSAPTAAPKARPTLRKSAARRTSAVGAHVPAAAQARSDGRGARLAAATPRAAVCTATPPPHGLGHGGAWRGRSLCPRGRLKSDS